MEVVFVQDQGNGLENITKWPSLNLNEAEVYICPFCEKKVAPANERTAIVVCMKGKLHIQYNRDGVCLNGNQEALPKHRFKVFIN